MDTKTCIYCKSTLAADLFVKGKNRCKPCNNSLMRDYYARNPQQRVKNRELVALGKNPRKRSKQALVNRLKAAPCTDCKRFFHPCAMDFDHLDPTQKTAAISQLIIRSCSDEKILEEIQKCELVCATCHRIRTYIRRYGEAAYLSGLPQGGSGT